MKRTVKFTGLDNDAYERTIVGGWMQLTNWGSPGGKILTTKGQVKRRDWLEKEALRFSEYETKIKEKRVSDHNLISLWRKYE